MDAGNDFLLGRRNLTSQFGLPPSGVHLPHKFAIALVASPTACHIKIAASL